MNVGLALRFQANLPIYFWGESVLVAAHLINRTPSPLLDDKSTFDILFGFPPAYNALRTFDCLCFAYNHKTKGDKFESRSRKCVFVGYPFGKRGWQLFHLDPKEIFVSRDVKFFEDMHPFLTLEDVNIVPENLVPLDGLIHDDFLDDSYIGPPLVTSFTSSFPNLTPPIISPGPNLSSPHTSPSPPPSST